MDYFSTKKKTKSYSQANLFFKEGIFVPNPDSQKNRILCMVYTFNHAVKNYPNPKSKL